MKSNFIRVISSLLLVAILISCFAVLTFAEDTTGDEEIPTKLIYSREYDEGWNHKNGFEGISPYGCKFSIQYEELSDFSYNYYLNMEGNGDRDGYLALVYKSSVQPKKNGAVLSFDVKVDDYTDIGEAIYMRTIGDATTGFTAGLLSIEENKFVLPLPGVAQRKAGKVITTADGSWLRVVVSYDMGDLETSPDHNYRICTKCFKEYTLDEIDSIGTCSCGTGLDKTKMHKKISARIYVGYADNFDHNTATPLTATELQPDNEVNLDTTRYYETAIPVNAGQVRGLQTFRFGFENITNSGKNTLGQGYQLDNIRLYNGKAHNILTAEEIAALEQGNGSVVSQKADKEIEILSGTVLKNDLQYIEEALIMKVGTSYGLYANTRNPILTDEGQAYGAPVKIDGKVFVPFQAILDHIDYPSFAHEDGISYDFATGDGSSVITVGRDVATVSGTPVALTAAPRYVKDAVTDKEYVVIAMDDVETLFSGYHVTYDELGLILISDKADLVNRDDDIDLMVDLMCRFIYDYNTGDRYYTDTKANTNNFTHPYIFANQSDFDYYNSVYKGEIADATLKSYIDTIVASAIPENGEMSYTTATVGQNKVNYYYGWNAWINDGVTVDTTGAGQYLKGTLTVSGDGSVINGSAINPHDDPDRSASLDNLLTYNDGYEYEDGRLVEAAEYAELIRLYALCYQITRKEAYGRLAYELAVALAAWKHWGSGYIVDCANATSAYATAYDWMYNAWTSWGYDVTVIEDAIYENGVYVGTQASKITPSANIQTTRRQGKFVEYTTMTGSANAVATSGMVIGSLALIGSRDVAAAENRADKSDAKYTTYVDASKWILENNIKTLMTNGLALYAPDGSYIESPSHWGYSTNSLLYMIGALNTAVGSDMGLAQTWGLDNTFIFACQIEYPALIDPETGKIQADGYQYWNYNDATVGSIDSSMFFMAADLLGQNSLAAIRMKQLERKTLSIFDVLCYKAEYATLDKDHAYDNLETTWVFDSCEGIVSRDHWGDGSLFTGIMGNSNSVAAGQIDSGNFIYANHNYTWFCDLGAENHNVYGYNSNDETKYTYYRISGEGANVVCLTSDPSVVPYGQAVNTNGDLMSYEYNEYGMMAVVNNFSAYGDLVNEAKRGILFTNDKKTVVIQDQIYFAGVQSVMWIGHTAADIILSSDGKTAWLKQVIDGEEHTIRCSIVSTVSDLKFKTMSASEYVLSGTKKPGQSASSGGSNEYDRSKYQRLCIDGGVRLTFECAVVIEEVENSFTTADDVPVQYEWTPMADWKISKEFVSGAADDNTIGNASLSDIKVYGDAANALVLNGKAFGESIDKFYISMAKAAACVATFRESMINAVPELKRAYKTYKVNLEKYEGFRDAINTTVSYNMDLGNAFSGYAG